MLVWNSSRYTLRKLKRQLKAIRKEDSPVISSDDILEFCSHLSKEAAADILDNGYDPETGELIYSKLKTITLAEIIGPEAKALIVGRNKGTRVFIGESEILE